MQYWRIVRAIARDLLGHAARPGIDFALTEIVRCKSQNETGVAKATMAECSRGTSMPTLEIAAAPLVVPLGKKARRGSRTWLERKADWLARPGQALGRERRVLMLGHPSAGQRKKPTDEEISRVQPSLA